MSIGEFESVVVTESHRAASDAAPELAGLLDDRSRTRHWLTGRCLLILADSLSAAAAWAACLVVSDRAVHQPAATIIVVLAAITVSWLLDSFGLHLGHVRSVRTLELAGCAKAAVASAVVVAAATADGRFKLHFGLRWPAIGAMMTLVTLLAERGMFRRVLSVARRRGRFVHRTLIVGTNRESLSILDAIEHDTQRAFEVVGMLGAADGSAVDDGACPYLGDAGALWGVVRECHITDVIICPTAFQSEEIERTVRVATLANAQVHVSSSLGGVDHERLRATSVGDRPLYRLERADLSGVQAACKRAADIVGASLLLLLASPLLIVAAIAIRLEDGGPILFRQERVGRGGAPFRMLKLRSMVPDAEARLATIIYLNERQGPLFKVTDDPRITRIGRTLRRTSIDELPQLWNVIRGDMSLVGPRPALASEVHEFEDAHRTLRKEVRPGITGMWQVEGRDSPDYTAARRFDLFYVENWSMMLDLVLLGRTVKQLLSHSAGPR